MTAEEELQGGIRNALERGQPIEKIVQTFINAGYPPADVQAAARAATEGATTIAPQPPSSAALPSPQPTAANVAPLQPSPISLPSQPQSQQSSNDKPKEEAGNGKVILLVVVLIMLLGALVASLLFREQILGLLG